MTPSTTHFDFPVDADSITPVWLTRVLHQSGTIRLSRVRTCAAAKMGAAGFIGDLARIELSYTIAEERAPRTLIAKFSNRDPGQRAVFHGIGFYERENRFYRNLASRTPIPTPDCYHAEIDLESGRSILLLEDLSDAVTIDVAEGCSLAQSELVIRQLAELHAHWWESEELRTASYIPPADQLLRIYHFTFQQQWPGLAERLAAIDPALVLSTELRELGNWLCQSSGDVFAPVARSPFTLVHMDIHLDNLVFKPNEQDRPLVVFDWQTFGLGRGATDLTYFMISAVPIGIRRQAEEALLGRYHRHLTERGVSNYTLDQCTEDYRRAAVWNLLIFTAVAAIENPDPVRRVYVKAVLPRLSAFLRDHSMAVLR